MLAGAATQLSRSRSTPDTPPVAQDACAAMTSPHGGVVWITAVAGVARTGLVDLIRSRLEPEWGVDVVAPDQVAAWIESDATEGRVAIVSAHAAVTSGSVDARACASAAGLAFIEILAVSDWDALVERAEPGILEQLAKLFVHPGDGPASRRRAAGPEAVIRLDWHGPEQIQRRVSDALARAGLSPAPHSSTS